MSFSSGKPSRWQQWLVGHSSGSTCGCCSGKLGQVFCVELLFSLVSLLRREKRKNLEFYHLPGWKRQTGQPQSMQDIKGKKWKLTFIIFE